MERRTFLRYGAAFLGGFLFSKVFSSEKETEQDPLPNKILKTPLLSPERLQMEKQYIATVINLEEIDLGFQILADKDLRMELLLKRHQLRRKKTKDLPTLPSKIADWAINAPNKWSIHPEVVAICQDTFPEAKTVIEKLLQKGKEKFRPDIATMNPDLIERTNAEEMMMNPGGMAQLVCFETGLKNGNLWYGFANIGEHPAITHLNPQYFPHGEEQLKELCGNMTKDTGLPFLYYNIPGSTPTSRDLSGGAVWLQMMPNNALDIYNELKSIGANYNPADIKSALVGNWVFLARGQSINTAHGIDYRFGYLRDYNSYIEKSLAKWNQLPEQIEITKSAAESYYEHFLKKKN